MRKRVFLAVLMVAAIALTTSCGLIEKNEEVDQQTVIIDVAGKQFTKAEVQQAVASTLSYQSYLYSMYGMNFDATSADTISAAQDNAISTLVQSAVLEKKEAEYGVDQFTDEELATLQQTVDSNYQTYMDSVKTNYFADTELTGDELDKAIEAKMTELGYSTKDDMLTSEKSSSAYDKLKAEIVKDVAVTDDEIQTEYDSKLAAAQASYASNLSQYGTDAQNGTTIYYRPAGYRYVKNLLRTLSEEDSKAISDLNTQITDKQSQLDTANTSLAALPEDAATDTEEQAKDREALTASVTTLTAELADLQSQLDSKTEAAYAALQPTIDEILAKIAAGEDFDKLIEEYGQDTGTANHPDGYLVCAGDTAYVAPFTEAAMALEKIGDVSPATRSTYGVHILKYVSDVTEGAVALDEVKDALSASLLTTKQDSLFNTTLEQWVTEANAKTYKDRLN
ncbi:MAG: peptidylprolyl isomerase [Eubacteriales bacterium]|nr:peptidylprolyl isomerase [Eubacteriales bacterium]